MSKLTTAQISTLGLFEAGWSIFPAYTGIFSHGAYAMKDGERSVSVRQATLDKLSALGLIERKRYFVDGIQRGFHYVRAESSK